MWRQASAGSAAEARGRCEGCRQGFRDFKDVVHPFFESNTLFLEGVFVLF